MLCRGCHPPSLDRGGVGEAWLKFWSKKAPVCDRGFGMVCRTVGGGYSAVFFLVSNPFRFSNSSILTPWRFMMIACWMIDSVLFQAQ